MTNPIKTEIEGIKSIQAEQRSDLDIAHAYFQQNPNTLKLAKKQSFELVGKALQYSYINTSGGIKEIHETLGKGGYGKVKRCVAEDGHEEALKIMPLKDGEHSDMSTICYRRQDQALYISDKLAKTLEIQHHFSPITGTCLRSDQPNSDDKTWRQKFYFSMTLIPGENLHDYILHNAGTLTQHQKEQIAIQCTQAVKHLHDNGIIHGDVKTNNFMVRLVDGEPKISIIDFDLAQPIIHQDLCTIECDIALAPNAYNIDNNAEYPLEMQRARFSQKGDIYGLGNVFHDLEVYPELSERMMASYPEHRPTMSEVLGTIQPSSWMAMFWQSIQAFSALNYPQPILNVPAHNSKSYQPTTFPKPIKSSTARRHIHARNSNKNIKFFKPLAGIAK